ncbi:hypothetical protein M408DRAFT_332740 [Serendipita vermifera MAFF 305830]|uniref:RRM domain-containing protein n=1 Tax=Serendipita vermifera MAFF 305830 TaxID=933852 RepID=A0A0C3ADR4_SERVB|nr:hypothetical protein M408DRAFT_332740 [Serendipita vermifera MAFF 305830]
MSGRGYPPPTAPHRGRGMGRGAGPSGYHGYESPYPGPALDNPYAEDGYNNYRENGNEYGNHYENTSDIRRGGGAGRPPRREHEDKVRDPLIEERLQRERPCRTLFIRNIKYETDSNEFRLKFEEFGEIKTFFDLISHRGMVFCTYYDMRAAERAKERLQGTELAGRPIDVHYSLPRDDQKNELNQGIITVTLIDSPSRGAIDDMELRRKLTAFGDVKSIQPYNNRPESRTVEFYDLRSADEAHGKLRHQTLQDGIIETDFLFMGDQLPPPGPAMQERARQDRPGAPRGGGGGGGGGRGGRGGRGRGRGGYDDRRGRDWEDEYYSRDHRRASPPRSHEDRWRERSPPPRGRMGSASESNQVDRDKMEQAKKVQDLLAALKQTSGGPAPASQPPAGYYPTSQPPPAAAAPAFGLPPHLAHIGALLQQALPPQQAQQAAAALQQYHASTNAAPAQPPYPGMAPQSYPPMPPPSAMFPGGQPASSGPYSYSPAGGLPPGNPPPGGPAAGGGYSTADIYALLERQKQAPQAPPAGALPPDSARYPYGPPGHGSQSTNSPPPAGGSAVPAHSIQDIMALLKRPS